jgi:hypothetical protein
MVAVCCDTTDRISTAAAAAAAGDTKNKNYEFRPSAATGCFRHGVSLHTSIVVKVDRGPHDSFQQPNRVHRHVERVITIFLCTWTVFIRRHLGGQPRAHFDIARMQRPTTIHHLA